MKTLNNYLKVTLWAVVLIVLLLPVTQATAAALDGTNTNAEGTHLEVSKPVSLESTPTPQDEAMPDGATVSPEVKLDLQAIATGDDGSVPGVTDPLSQENSAGQEPIVTDIQDAQPEVQEDAAAMHIILFLDAQGAVLHEMAIEEGTPIEKPVGVIPEKPGHRFMGWADEAEAPVIYTFGMPASEALTLVPVFEETKAAQVEKVADPTPELTEAQEQAEEVVQQQDQETADPTSQPVEAQEQVEEAVEQRDLEATDPSTEQPQAQGQIALNGTQPERHIDVSVQNEGGLQLGDTVTLCGELMGYDDLTVTYQWQSNTSGTWSDISGAEDLTYSFMLDTANSGDSYRLLVTIWQS